MPRNGPPPKPYIDLTASSPPRPVSTVLIDAIRNAPEDRIRLALRNACETSNEVLEIVQEMLLVPADRVNYKASERDTDSQGLPVEDESGEDDEDDDEDEDEAEDEDDSGHRNSVSKPSSKRLRPRFAECINCYEAFDVESNDKDSCIWHPGKKEPDYHSDFWADHDEGCHGVIEDLGDEYPEGFMFTCCDRLGDNEGCKIGTHVESAYKRARY